MEVVISKTGKPDALGQTPSPPKPRPESHAFIVSLGKQSPGYCRNASCGLPLSRRDARRERGGTRAMLCQSVDSAPLPTSLDESLADGNRETPEEGQGGQSGPDRRLVADRRDSVPRQTGKPCRVRKDEAGRIPRQDREENPRDGVERGAANWTAPSVNSELVRAPGPKANWIRQGQENATSFRSASGLSRLRSATNRRDDNGWRARRSSRRSASRRNVRGVSHQPNRYSDESMRDPCGQASRTLTDVPRSWRRSVTTTSCSDMRR